mmetsp:Transcript_3118/g.11248  ORF Transcript_3118/g.11248 Transcript_3118/m.11248 type:complete len:83 (+) Transcript_3118:2784-3032(+)
MWIQLEASLDADTLQRERRHGILRGQGQVEHTEAHGVHGPVSHQACPLLRPTLWLRLVAGRLESFYSSRRKALMKQPDHVKI